MGHNEYSQSNDRSRWIAPGWSGGYSRGDRRIDYGAGQSVVKHFSRIPETPRRAGRQNDPCQERRDSLEGFEDTTIGAATQQNEQRTGTILMNIRLLLLCLRHPRSWRNCVREATARDPKVNEWREQRHAAVEATKHELRTMPTDPITAAVMGVPPRQQGSGE
jgi:hypothetical protein